MIRGDIGDFIGEYALLSQIDVKELWNPDAEATTIFKSFVGAAGLFEMQNGKVSILRVNQKMCDVMEVDLDEIRKYSANILDAFSSEQREAALSMFASSIAAGGESSCQIQYFGIRSKRGKRLFLRANEIAVSLDRHVFFVVCEDITLHQKEIEEHRWQDDQIKILIEDTKTAAFDYDPESDVLIVYRSIPGKGIKKKNVARFMARLPADPVIHPTSIEDFTNFFRSALSKPGISGGEFLFNIDKNGFRWYRITAASVQDDLRCICRIVGRLDDIQLERDRRRACSDLEKTLRKKAEKDSITELLAKNAVNTLIRNRIRCLTRNEQGYLMLVNLDNFNQVNDALGCAFGETLLGKIGRTLTESFEPDDLLGRIDENAFVVYTQQQPDQPAVLKKAEKLLRSIGEISVPEAGPILGSIGIAAVPSGETNFHIAMKHADYALHQAKEHPKERYFLFSRPDGCDCAVREPRILHPVSFFALKSILLDSCSICFSARPIWRARSSPALPLSAILLESAGFPSLKCRTIRA